MRALWLSALRGAQYVWLSPLSFKRIPWAARDVSVYFDRNFVPVPHGPFGLYMRKGQPADPRTSSGAFCAAGGQNAPR